MARGSGSTPNGTLPEHHEHQEHPSPNAAAHHAIEFSQQSGKLSHQPPNESSSLGIAVQAEFITPQDAAIVTSDGGRLPGVPVSEALKLNTLHEKVQKPKAETEDLKEKSKINDGTSGKMRNAETQQKLSKVVRTPKKSKSDRSLPESKSGTLRTAMPPSHTHPLFPPLPLYGPPSVLRNMQCWIFRITSFWLSLAFLGGIVIGALVSSIPKVINKAFHKVTFRNLDTRRPFYSEELRRAEARKEKDSAWARQATGSGDIELEDASERFLPTAGGPDPIICDVGYYARRVGLDVETFKVQTEDGFIIDLWHVYDPREYTKLHESSRQHQGPAVFQASTKRFNDKNRKPKFPVLLMHGLLQSAGAYCCNDDDSLAFWLCKSGYDVWLGNNRCGFEPTHSLLEYSDPRMWCWNIRQMGVFDLPALMSRVLSETGFDKIGLICHSQGTTETLVALAKEQRPDLGEKLTVFCALAPAAYAGSLIGKMYFRFMKMISPALFRLVFGIHAFIPFMMQMHSLLPPQIYGWFGYKVFSFLFDWSDKRWDRGLRNRMFQFSPVYVSAESMRWWLGRECFAKHKCVLATKEIVKAEDRMDEEDAKTPTEGTANQGTGHTHHRHAQGSTAWYNEQAPPFALWVCGNDDLVDGRKLLRRFEKGREPHVKVVHSKVIAEYEHLDVIWAMDAVDQVFKEIREVLWKTCDVRNRCRVPEGCDDVPEWTSVPRTGAENTTAADPGLSSSSSSEDEEIEETAMGEASAV